LLAESSSDTSGHEHELIEFRVRGFLRVLLWFFLLSAAPTALPVIAISMTAGRYFLIWLGMMLQCLFFGLFALLGLARIVVSDTGIVMRLWGFRIESSWSQVTKLRYHGLLFQLALSGNRRTVLLHPWLHNYADLYRMVRDRIPDAARPSALPLPMQLALSWKSKGALCLGAFGPLLSLSTFMFDTPVLAGFDWTPALLGFPALSDRLMLGRCHIDDIGVHFRGGWRRKSYLFQDLDEVELIHDTGFMSLFLRFRTGRLYLSDLKYNMAPERLYDLLDSKTRL